MDLHVSLKSLTKFQPVQISDCTISDQPGYNNLKNTMQCLQIIGGWLVALMSLVTAETGENIVAELKEVSHQPVTSYLISVVEPTLND